MFDFDGPERRARHRRDAGGGKALRRRGEVRLSGLAPDVAPPPAGGFDVEVETLIVGAGACGLVAALAAHEAGQSVCVIEADALPAGSTALSAGLIPAAGTALQRAAGIDDSPVRFAADIQRKAHGENAPALVSALAEGAAPVIDWLATRHRLPFTLVDDFDYPGHTRRRMHGLPTRAGTELIDALRTACEREGVDIVCGRRATTIHHDGPLIRGVSVHARDGGVESLGCDKLILACNGFGGNRSMVEQRLPAIADALWFGHDGNRGEAILWGERLGAASAHLGAYQGHGNVAHPHGILITWAVLTEGGVQLNARGERFHDESAGYSEAARAVLAQPGGIAVTVFDERIAGIARQFEDFRRAEAIGAVETADTLETLSERLALPAEVVARTVRELPSNGTDAFGRTFGGVPLHPPYRGVRVTGALFHTQGGLAVDGDGRVGRIDGESFPNLFAGGGAACGVSGRADDGYLSGNGLLSAVVLGHNAGRASADPDALG